LSGAGGQETRSLGTAALNTDDNKGGQSDENAEDQLGLDDSNWRQIQRRLTDLGHSTKGIDGSAGPGTRAAIKLWQSSKSLAASGFLNRPLYEALMGEKLPVATATPEAKSESKSESTSRSARRSRSSDDERPTPRRSAGSNSGDSDGSARKAGEFLGGVVRGATGLKLPF
jgi:peptidoglycan hydrolase-like protein with peptidoglycan-binding domain